MPGDMRVIGFDVLIFVWMNTCFAFWYIFIDLIDHYIYLDLDLNQISLYLYLYLIIVLKELVSDNE